jgi:hypothetical protein
MTNLPTITGHYAHPDDDSLEFVTLSDTDPGYEAWGVMRHGYLVVIGDHVRREAAAATYTVDVIAEETPDEWRTWSDRLVTPAGPRPEKAHVWAFTHDQEAL